MVAITHAKVSAIADDPDAAAAGQVLPSDWNEEHVIDGLGTAAEADVGDFATAAQGALADTAVQPADLAPVATSGAYGDLTGKPTLGTAAAAATSDFASAAQGAKADTALQPADWASPGDIGTTTPAAATFTTLTANGTAQFGRGSANYLQATGSATGSGVSLSAQGSDANINLLLARKGTGNIQLQGTTVLGANQVNSVQVSGSTTGNQPSIAATGTDTNINMNFASKGAASLIFNANGAEQFRTAARASAVNSIQLNGNTTGNPAEVQARGSDTNVDLAFVPKGTGNVRFGSFSALAAEVITGYITIKDSGGTTRKLAVIA